tara:strand:+ start:2159 stop:2923 length:765 start_codon:yes stop_codon:yes gene_type:complete
MSLRWCPAISCAVVLFYLNIVLTNLVSLRQKWYINTFLNGTSWEPLHDTLFVDWIKGYNIEQYVSFALRDMVDVCTYGWVCITILAWWVFSRSPILPAKVLCCQLVIIPCFSISQLLTIVPDATPNCVDIYDIPSDLDLRWVFWRWPQRSCGNMLWSSDLAQLIIFAQVAVQMIPHYRKRLKWLVWIVGECWTFITVAFIFSSKYQYSMDVFITIIVVKLLITHHWIDYMANYLFIKNGLYYERAPQIEMRATI